eukprot:TRINITY_DN7781_c0_g5_i1.p1 TRINITY_DN7781_c0_g5~~TRINITY_DN7781_c0_g5_i1.p1  ORF type:complete len:635 (-),score=111.69 TRINITY_DN7781_c0_g5_i1:206-2110(-)
MSTGASQGTAQGTAGASQAVGPSKSKRRTGGKDGKTQKSVSPPGKATISGSSKGSSADDLALFLRRLLAEERAKLTKLLGESDAFVASRFEAHLRDLYREGPTEGSTQDAADPASKQVEPLLLARGEAERSYSDPSGDTGDGAVVVGKAVSSSSPAFVEGQGDRSNTATSATLNGKTVRLADEPDTENATVPGSENLGPTKSNRALRKFRKTMSAMPQMSRAERLINNPIFECVFAGLIFFNALCMACEQQYYGIDVGYQMEYPGSHRSAKEAWPRAQTFFFVTENFFGVIFTLEVVAKAFVFKWNFFKSWWNFYDTVIIFCWIVDQMMFSMFMHPLVLRLARMGRLLRLLRFAKTFQVFDVLHLLIRSLSACLSALMWSAMFVLLVMMGTAIMMVYMLEEEFQNESIPVEERMKLYKYFGTFTNSMFSMYELTMANWAPIARTVVSNVSEWYIIFFMVYRTTVGFAILKVVTAIFNAETFRVTQMDDDIMLLHKERQIATHTRRMQQLLLEGDDAGDGYLSFGEFQRLMEDKKVQKWLLAQDIELRDIELAFRILDKAGDGRISAEELVRGLAHLKGAARSTDMVGIVHAFSRVELVMDRICEVLHIEAPTAVLQNSVAKTFIKDEMAPLHKE